MPTDHVFELARRQHGVLTRRELRECGASDSTISRWTRRGMIQRLHHGVYLLGVGESRESRWLAAVRAGGSGAVLSHMSAACCWEVVDGRLVRCCHVTVPRRRAPKLKRIRIHRSRFLDPEDCAVHKGIPVTTPARTVVDVGAQLGPRDLERVLARCERQGLTDASEVARVAGRFSNRRGSGVVRALVARSTEAEFTRSTAEDRFLELVQKAQLPRPRTNLAMGPWEVDFFWSPPGLAVEIDGFAYHGSRAAFENDRAKDAWLHRKGVTVLRFTWRQITEAPMATIVTVAQALKSS